MARIRVMQLVDGLAIGAESGGAELHALRIARFLDQTRFAPAVFSAYAYGGQAEQQWIHDLRAVDIPVAGLLPPGRRAPALLRGLWDSINQFQPQIIHSHSERYDVLNGLLCRLHPRKLRAVRTIHLDQQWQTRPYLRGPLEETVLPFLMSCQVGVSAAIYDMLQERGLDESRVALCHNGIDAAAFEDGFSARTELEESLPGEGNVRIGLIGRMTEQKGHDVLLAAFARLQSKCSAHLLLVGDGPLRALLEAQAETFGIGDRAHFLGARSDVWAILNRLDLFVLPSRWEGFPTVLLEAMSQGVPVVASDIPGNRELVLDGETGLRVPQDEPEALAAAISQLLEDPGFAQRLAQRAKHHAGNYTLQNMARCYERIYRQITA